jgi:hypothetical protein
MLVGYMRVSKAGGEEVQRSRLMDRFKMLCLDALVGGIYGFLMGFWTVVGSLRGSFLERLDATVQGWLFVGLPDVSWTIEWFSQAGAALGGCVWMAFSAFSSSEETAGGRGLRPLWVWLVIWALFTGLFIAGICSPPS